MESLHPNEPAEHIHKAKDRLPDTANWPNHCPAIHCECLEHCSGLQLWAYDIVTVLLDWS